MPTFYLSDKIIYFKGMAKSKILNFREKKDKKWKKMWVLFCKMSILGQIVRKTSHKKYVSNSNRAESLTSTHQNATRSQSQQTEIYPDIANIP